ncbi:MAG: pyridoxal-phosphate dependent enzyme [Gammaproteobacteria bacterium]|nr:pyridoxal-phosphate dependent enzyme [Gammaproteobacteria bacterium]
MFRGLPSDIVDQSAYRRTVERFRNSGIRLPRIAELAYPLAIKKRYDAPLRGIDPDTADPLNLFRVHWHNDATRRGISDVPGYLILPSELTGVAAKIVVALGNRFPMIEAHKVLAAYGCLVPRLVSGTFDPTRHRAIWPSTGNYCRGGVAISRILGCRGVAVLPEGMSQERFDWLQRWVTEPADIIRTPGSESNVKEIYDACNTLEKDNANIILNQFNEFGNYIIHRTVTGAALERVFASVNSDGDLRAAAFVCASGSAGTLAAGDYLKSRLGTRICAVEALECPTLLYNGFGEHNIQGIGDKHVPLIHNVFNTDFVTAVPEAASDTLNLLFNSPAGREFLTARTGVPEGWVGALENLGLSSIANVVAAIKLSKYLKLGNRDLVLTVATDGAAMYGTELAKSRDRYFAGQFGELEAAETYGRYLLGAVTDHFVETDRRIKERIFNLGYYTWVEQQGVSVDDFNRRRDPGFWEGLTAYAEIWDQMIDEFNRSSGAAVEAPGFGAGNKDA